MRLRIADTSAVYAFFDRGDEHHAKARKAFESPDVIWLPAEILTETLSLLQRRQGPQVARAVGSYLWSQPNTDIQPSDTAILMAAWEEFAAGGALSFPDCVVVAACRELDAEPLTFDRAIVRALRR